MVTDFIGKIKMEKAIREALKILMDGRTYYDGYFDIPFEKLSRIDKATKILLDCLHKEKQNGR